MALKRDNQPELNLIQNTVTTMHIELLDLVLSSCVIIPWHVMFGTSGCANIQKHDMPGDGSGGNLSYVNQSDLNNILRMSTLLRRGRLKLLPGLVHSAGYFIG